MSRKNQEVKQHYQTVQIFVRARIIHSLTLIRRDCHLENLMAMVTERKMGFWWNQMGHWRVLFVGPDSSQGPGRRKKHSAFCILYSAIF